jgi:hypothetical protein
MAQPAEAEIVYTKAHVHIGTHGVYKLDLNHDGIVDFRIQEVGDSVRTSQSVGTVNSLLAKEALGNAVEGTIGTSRFTRKRYYASALKPDAQIGSRKHFIKGGTSGEFMVCFQEDQDSRTGITSGKWINVTNRYLGLKFQIKGKTHYGWARLTVHNSKGKIGALLTGYAYETVPNKPIKTGKTKGPDVLTVQPASLGHLAYGAPAIPAWRAQH